MILSKKPPIHLSHCYGVHTNGWAENFAIIKERACSVRDRVCPDRLFGLGLRLTRKEADVLCAGGAPFEELQQFLSSNNMYTCMIDGFMYGPMHEGSSKDDLYEPDWRTDERRDFTIELAQTLARLLPNDTPGTISTLPGSLKVWITDKDDQSLMARNMAAVIAELAKIAADTGRIIQLCVAPEPDCFLETTPDTIDFFKDIMLTEGAREVAHIMGVPPVKGSEFIQRHFGVAFDTCHATMQNENLEEALAEYRTAGMPICRVRLSQPVICPWTADNWEVLLGFDDEVHMHQVRAIAASGQPYSWHDLPAAMQELPTLENIKEVRVHFHLPLSMQKTAPDGILTTSPITPCFFHALRKGDISQIEIDAGAFETLPEHLQTGGAVKSIAREYVWTLSQLGFGE